MDFSPGLKDLLVYAMTRTVLLSPFWDNTAPKPFRDASVSKKKGLE